MEGTREGSSVTTLEDLTVGGGLDGDEEEAVAVLEGNLFLSFSFVFSFGMAAGEEEAEAGGAAVSGGRDFPSRRARYWSLDNLAGVVTGNSSEKGENEKEK